MYKETRDYDPLSFYELFFYLGLKKKIYFYLFVI